MTLVLDSLARAELRSVGGKCYCVPHSTDYISVFAEEDCGTNCIINYLSQQNTDVSLWLTENFLSEKGMFFSSTCLKALFAFLLNSDHTFAEKGRVVTILLDQLEMHPSCAEYTFDTYKNLLLEPEENHFKKLTLLDYLLNQLQNQLSSTGACFSTNRISRRSRKKVAYGEEQKPNSKEKEVDLMKTSGPAKDLVFVLLNILTDILTHDLRATLNRDQSPTASILAKLIFKGSSSTLLFQPMTYKLFNAYKDCSSAAERRYVVRLVELTATLAWRVDLEQNEANVFRLGSCCQRFVSDFLIGVFDENEIREPYSIDKVTSLNLVWLRYHAAHNILAKMSDRNRVSNGVKGVVHELCALLQLPSNSGRENRLNESTSGNSDSARGIDEELIAACRTDDLETLKRLSEADIDLNNAPGGSGQSALHIAAQHGSVDCVSFLLNYSTGSRLLNVLAPGKEGLAALQYAERGGHAEIVDMLTGHADNMARRVKRCTPLALQIFMIITDTMIRMLEKLKLDDRQDTVRYLEQLLLIVKELSQVDNVPSQVLLWSKVLGKIEIVD